jgi:hypothetical protein
MNIYWMIQSPEFINPRTRMFFSSIYPLSKSLSFLGDPVACLQIFRSFVCCSQSFSQKVEELKCFFVLVLLDGKFFTDQGGPILIELVGNHGKLWRTHTHTLSLCVISRVSELEGGSIAV